MNTDFTCVTYPDAHLKFSGINSPLITTSPVTPVLTLRPDIISSKLECIYDCVHM